MLWNHLCTVQICITFMVNKKDDWPIVGQEEIRWERQSRSTPREEEGGVSSVTRQMWKKQLRKYIKGVNESRDSTINK